MPDSIYGLIGYPLSHSFSRSYFSNKFEKDGTQAVYRNFELKNTVELKKQFNGMTMLKGLNVTIPHKESVMAELDEIDPVAAEIGAVNTIKILENGKWIGYNTDAFGFRQCIKPFFKSHHERALILGTGGASKAIYHVLNSLGVDCLYVSRSPKDGNQISYDQLNEYVMRAHPLIVNCTPLGTFPNVEECPNIPYQFITEKHLLVDLIYNPEETLFMKKGLENRAKSINGLTMLHQQAEKAWKIWTS